MRELERKLEQAEQSVKARKAALDIRERALNNREAKLKGELAQAEAKVKKDLAARERQLLRDRLAFHASSRRAVIKSPPALTDDRCNHPSERSSTSDATNTASAVSSALHCSPAASSTSAPQAQEGSNLASRQLSAVQANKQGLHRVAKRYNLRSQAKPVAKAECDTSSKPATMLSKHKIRSDGDLASIPFPSNDKENNLSIVAGSAGVVDQPNSSCDAKTTVAPKQRDVNKTVSRIPKAAKPFATPIYHLRSAAAKCNGALELRRAGL